MVANNPNIRPVKNPHKPPVFTINDSPLQLHPIGDSARLERIENRLEAIAELLAVLLDTVQQDEQEEVSQDLDGVHIPSGGNAGGTL